MQLRQVTEKTARVDCPAHYLQGAHGTGSWPDGLYCLPHS